MSLSKKFTIIFISSIILIAAINVIAFLFFYWVYLNIYLSDNKINKKDEITIDYINDIIEKQAIDEIDNIFTDTEIEFFELLEDNDWVIPLNKDENIDIVINYLIKSWVTPKYIEEIIPTDNFSKVLESLKNYDSAEYKFVNNLTDSIIITNLIALLIIIIIISILSTRIMYPIKKVTRKIKNIKNLTKIEEINYKNKKDEVWLLINAINWLNKRLKLQEHIKNRLLADISHELKTPISSIQCYLEWISDWIIKLDNKNLNSIKEEMNRLIKLVNKIMEFEEFESKNLKLEKSKENIFTIIRNIVETNKKKIKENKQMIKIVWDENLEIELDKNLFMQLVHNIIWNFLKYAWKRTLLTINITKKYISFNDNWKWTKSSNIPYLTEKFFQWWEKTWDITNRGLWIWLSLVQKIAESHNWNIDIKTDLWKWFTIKLYI